MGWRGTLRSFNAVMRAADRDHQRRRKLELKQEIADISADAVESWKEYIDNLTSIHCDLANAIDWKAISLKQKPPVPQKSDSHESEAREKLAKFKPSLWDRMRGRDEKKRLALTADIDKAKAQDQQEYDDAMHAHKESVSEWKEDADFAIRVLSGDPHALRDIIAEAKPDQISDWIGKAIDFGLGDDFIHAKPELHSDGIVPKFRRKLLASGKLSETKMPIGQFNELYQDYVASVALKVAGDLFSITPLSEVYVTCHVEMLNSSTGHNELTPILSVQFVRPTFSKLYLSRIDPSDALSNFNHEMKFKKTKGLEKIEPLVGEVVRNDT